MRIRRNQRAANAPSARMAARATALTTVAAFAAAGATLGLMSLTGCGGGGDDNGGGSSPSPSSSSSGGPVSPSPSPSSITRNYSVRINWGARSRDVLAGALSSAVSARIGISRSTTVNTPSGPDWIQPPFVVNRAANAAAYADTYTSPNQVTFNTSQAQYLIVTFHAQADGNGPLVGYCILPASIDGASGNLLGNVQVIGSIASVEVPAGQQFIIGQPTDLVVTCKTATGFVIPVTPGSIFTTVAGGTDNLQTTSNGQLNGLKPGPATVRATVDGVSSNASPVTVVSTAVTTVNPTSAQNVVVSWEETQQFTASVAPAPDQTVLWVVQNRTPGDSGAAGSIDSNGLYTAPKRADKNPLKVRVVATSLYDSTKSGFTDFTVTSLVGVTVTPNPGRVAVNKTLQMSASVSHTTNQSVTWSVANAPGYTGSPGSIDANTGLYTASSDRRVVVITATSVYDPTKSASAQVTVEAGGADITVD